MRKSVTDLKTGVKRKQDVSDDGLDESGNSFVVCKVKHALVFP